MFCTSCNSSFCEFFFLWCWRYSLSYFFGYLLFVFFFAYFVGGRRSRVGKKKKNLINFEKIKHFCLFYYNLLSENSSFVCLRLFLPFFTSFFPEWTQLCQPIVIFHLLKIPSSLCVNSSSFT